MTGVASLHVQAKERQAFAGKLLALAKRSRAIGPRAGAGVQFVDKGFGFDQEGRAAFNELVKWLLRDKGWSAKYDEGHLSNLVATEIGDVRRSLDYADALKAAERLDSDWRGLTQRSHVYVPIENVEMTLREFRIGQARLVRLGATRRAELEANVRRAYSGSKHAQAEVDARVRRHLQSFDELGRVASVVEVTAVPERGFELAYEETRRALDFLNYAASIVHAQQLRRAAGITGDAFRGRRNHLLVARDFTNFVSSLSVGEAIFPIRLDTDFRKDLKRLGLAKVSSMLTKPKPTDFEEAIIQALHWYSDAYLQSSLHNELLGLTTVLETFFTRGGRGSTVAIAEGVAFTLVQQRPPPKRLEVRKQVSQRVRDLYDMRGRVTHGAKSEILAADVDLLRHYAVNVIQVMLRNPHHWQSRKELHAWIDDQRLS